MLSRMYIGRLTYQILSIEDFIGIVAHSHSVILIFARYHQTSMLKLSPHNCSLGVLFMKVCAPLTEARRSAKSSLSLIPAPFSRSLSSAVKDAPPISLVRASPSSGVGSSEFSLLPKFSTGPTLYPPWPFSAWKSSSYSLVCSYLSLLFLAFSFLALRLLFFLGADFSFFSSFLSLLSLALVSSFSNSAKCFLLIDFLCLLCLLVYAN